MQQYHSVHDERVAVVETLTPVREDDGQWRMVGYFIRWPAMSAAIRTT